MYVYFESANSVLTCETYPQLLSVEEMKRNRLEHMCNKWEKTVSEDGTFTLSFRYIPPVCECDNSPYVCMMDYDEYECYNCGTLKSQLLKDVDHLYLQNSGNVDVVCVGPSTPFCRLCEVSGCPNVYKWMRKDDDGRTFALHIKNGVLSDANMSYDTPIIQSNYRMTFAQRV